MTFNVIAIGVYQQRTQIGLPKGNNNGSHNSQKKMTLIVTGSLCKRNATETTLVVILVPFTEETTSVV